jgi:hypothetical protein
MSCQVQKSGRCAPEDAKNRFVPMTRRRPSASRYSEVVDSEACPATPCVTSSGVPAAIACAMLVWRSQSLINKECSCRPGDF